MLIIFGAKYLIYFVAAGAAVALALTRRKDLVWVTLLGLILGYVLARVAGLFYSHPQPFSVSGVEPLVPHAVDNAFPSDHTLLGGVFATAAWLADWRAGALLWALTLLVGASRVAAGLHAWVDIAASVLLACVAVWLAQTILKRLKLI